MLQFVLESLGELGKVVVKQVVESLLLCIDLLLINLLLHSLLLLVLLRLRPLIRGLYRGGNSEGLF
jgi:hypothetical protein